MPSAACPRKKRQGSQRQVQRRLPVRAARDVNQRPKQLPHHVKRVGFQLSPVPHVGQRACQLAQLQRARSMHVLPPQLSVVVPLRTGEDPALERIYRVSGVEHVLAQPGHHDHRPAEYVTAHQSERPFSRGIHEGKQTQRNDRRHQSRVLAAHRTARQEPLQAPRSQRFPTHAPPALDQDPDRAPRDRSTSALRRTRWPPSGKPTASRDRRAPQSNPPGATPACRRRRRSRRPPPARRARPGAARRGRPTTSRPSPPSPARATSLH